jgi:transposase
MPYESVRFMKIDGRTLSHETSEHIRLMAVRRVQAGEKPSAVMDSYGLCRTTIYRWLRAAKKNGESALKARKATGRTPKLTEKQKQQIRRWICGKDPRQYHFDFGLWTRQIVAELIEQKLGKRLGLSTVGRVLAELEITPQKPLRRAYERDPKAIAKWVNEDYPLLKKRAKRGGAEIFFLDEAGIRSDAPLQRTWGAKGQTPVVRTSGQRQSVNAISAVTLRGGFWYSVYTGRLNATRFVTFLKQFIRGRRRPIFLVVDRHPTHRAACVARYVQSLKGRLELHFLPGYAPELNPDEFVWNHIRQHGTSKKPLKQNESLHTRMECDLKTLKKNPRMVRSFFYAPSVAYVMA